jgi:hypothetical protein
MNAHSVVMSPLLQANYKPRHYDVRRAESANARSGTKQTFRISGFALNDSHSVSGIA